MNELDTYYRALLELRNTTNSVRQCAMLNAAIAAADAEDDKIVVTRAKCTVDEDWICAIEEGLIHIEKAIKEERQFIRSNGEVVPIEKVKNVSKESVQHLARHGNLITHVHEDENDIVPDKLFSVERLNDYTVYENRFLYMLLCYLRDFVTLRYNKILDLTNKYDGALSMNKTVSSAKRKMTFVVDLKEERRDDRYLSNNNKAKPLIDRIDIILKTILAFLATPLMEYASKVAMLKPPITKTNVLKMDNNFKGAVKLYDFIIAYDKAGYSVEDEVLTISPFNDNLAAELADCSALISFITYEYGLGITSELKERYIDSENRRRLEELRKKTEQLEALSRRLKKSDVSVEEYILALEKHVRALDAECSKIESLRNEISAMKAAEREYVAKIGELTEVTDALKQELIEEKQKQILEKAMLQKQHQSEMDALCQTHKEELRVNNERHEKELEEIRLHIREKENGFAMELDRERAVSQSIRDDLAQKTDEYDQLYERFLLAEAIANGVRARRKEALEDYTDKESFNELEKQYNAFLRFYKKQWQKTKKKIRKNTLKIENLKRTKDDSDSLE